jgi:nucleoid DNA-binding protein
MTEESRRCVVIIFETTAEAFGEGDRIEIRGFGSFALREP